MLGSFAVFLELAVRGAGSDLRGAGVGTIGSPPFISIFGMGLLSSFNSSVLVDSPLRLALW